MVLVKGVNAGFLFVGTSPSADPEATDGQYVVNGSAEDKEQVIKDTAPIGATKITEVGWWCDTATTEANFEVGLYAADGAVVPNEAGTLLQVERTNAKGTGAGWKKVTGLNWAITAGTAYWIGVQLDRTASGTTFTDKIATGNADARGLKSTLTDPFGGGALQDRYYAFYAVTDAVPPEATPSLIGEAVI